ncbi:MAG: quinone oxidoreductase [Anaerolineae bacterium]|nr:quinone oxidoreductase [Anaerolineae bacterium]
MKAIRFHDVGGPDVLQFQEVEMPTPEAGQVRIKLHAIGVNYIDIYHRTGLYKLPLPAIPGQEGAGIVDAVGANVTDFHIGDRVAFVLDAPSYAEYTVVPTVRLVQIPDDVSFQQAAAALLQGLTAHYLCFSTYPLKQDEWCLIHAAAGGAGQLTVQMAKIAGARVIGTVSTQEKARVAQDAGCDEVILYTQTDFVPEVKRITNNKGLPVVYDSVGKDTFQGSLECLAPRGYMVSWGNASGPVPPLDPRELMRKGSLYLTRPTLGHYIATRQELDWRAADLFRWLAVGRLRVRIDRTFALQDAAEAHRYIESRASMGKILIEP